MYSSLAGDGSGFNSSTTTNGKSNGNNCNSPQSSFTSSSCAKVAWAVEHKKLDRSMSEPADRIAPDAVINKSLISIRSSNNQLSREANSSRYKTELCRPFEENGTCKYGDKCQFAHGTSELRNLLRHPKYKTELCR